MNFRTMMLAGPARANELFARLAETSDGATFERRDPARDDAYSYEQRNTVVLDESLERRLRANRKACAYLQSEAPWYRRTATFFVMSAKRKETRERRLDVLIEASARGERIGLLRKKSPSTP